MRISDVASCPTLGSSRGPLRPRSESTENVYSSALVYIDYQPPLSSIFCSPPIFGIHGANAAIMRILRSAPAFAAYDSRSLSNCYELFCGQVLVLLVQAVGPVNVEIDRIESPQAKVQTGIIARVETGLAQHRLRLHLATVTRQYPRSYRAAVRLHSLEFNLDPILLLLHVVAQQ